MTTQKNHRQLKWIFLAIAVTALFTAGSLFFGASTVKTEPEEFAKLVETIKVTPVDETITVEAYGTVLADRELSLRPEVSGRVTKVSDNLVSGGIVESGELLVQLDPRDYINNVEQEKAAVEKALFDLKVEEGRQVVAKREWEQLQSSIIRTELGEELALRKPHLKEKKAALEAAESRLRKAELDLKRTEITSPMKAVVISENVEVGDYLTSQMEVAKLVATDQFRVQVSVPLSKLKWIKVPKDGEESSKVKVIQDLGGFEVVRSGRVLRLLGDLDTSGRMARVHLAVEDPLGVDNQEFKENPLLIGTYTKVEIEGPKMEGVFVLPREAIREEDKVWIKNQANELEVRKVGIIQKLEKVVMIDSGLKNGEEVVISNLPVPIPGTILRTAEEGDSP